MDPPQMSPASTAFFSTTSKFMEPHSSFAHQPVDGDLYATTAVEEDKEADDGDEEGDDSGDADDLDD